jgi:3-oxo-5alpha-steroid 4-dehydrogenase
MTPDNRFLDDMVDTANRVEPARVVADADAEQWDDACDVLVVGVGLAGACAALRSAEDPGLSVIAIDRGLGGGASKLSGGVVYMGGGTKAQREAGVEDSPENMAAYLAFELGDIVRPETRARFAAQSTGFQDWLEHYGARFGGPATDAKTSYPNDASLYFSGNEVTPQGRALATPAQRGHRAKPPGGGEPTQLSGQYLLPPLLTSIDAAANIKMLRQTRATRLVVDASGAVVGIDVLRIPPGFAAWRHGLLYGLSNNTPLAALGLLGKVRGGAVAIEQRHARPLRIRVRRGVILSAGGFTYNRSMMAKTAPAYLASVPLGTIGDDGSGIKLGMSVGAKTDRLDRVSAWKFLYPPAAWTKSVSIGPNGQRLISEEFYGARTGEAVFERAGGKAWLILDTPLQDIVVGEIAAMKKLLFQKIQFRALMKDYTVSADTLSDLAHKIGVSAAALSATIADYNAAIDAGATDACGKGDGLRRKIETGPYFATDAGAALKLSPIPALTMGGLVCDEDSGQVASTEGGAVPGLYAAGRTAVGICSHYYVSGLSLADCIFSGWRAADALKSQLPKNR